MSRAVDPEDVANRILLSLPMSTFRRLRPALHPMTIRKGQQVNHVNGPIEHMYFVNQGLISVIKTMHDGRTVEIGAVGVEGITDAGALLGLGEALLDSVVQVPGSVFRIERKTLLAEMAKDKALNDMMQRYVRFAFAQIAQTAACNRLHALDERCCRWLLIAHDSALTDTFPLTHEFLAMMLGVQREGVSLAAQSLKRAKLIDYRHGKVTVIDRKGLEANACECYGETRAGVEDLFRLSPVGKATGRQSPK